MIKKMLVNASNPEERRVAIVEDGVLSELDIEIVGREQTKGNIYKAAVVRVETGLQAAFVDYGAERLGFLQLGEIHPSLYPQRSEEDNKSRPRINDILHRGQEILVQITKEERGNKGAALTTFLSLPGRYMVLMPDDNARGISRKIPDGADRKALRAAISDLELPENMGYIIRTAAIGKSSDELKRDLDYLLRLYANISTHAKNVSAPAMIYQESSLVIRSIRDYFTLEMDEVLIDDPTVYNEAREFFTQVMPHHLNIVKLHQEQRPIFSKYQIEEQIDTISQNQVNLPSGGSIVIDPTEALVAIDVNSGKMASEQGIEATAFKTNLEAADEVARQLRLRDLGGLVVIDFIDMRDRKHGREIEKRLKTALSGDKARVTVGRISQFGLMEMSRQRIKASLAAAAWYSCPHCQGRGKVKSTEAQAVAIMRKIHAGVAKKQIGKVEAAIPSEVAEYLLNTRREELLDMERRYNTSIYLKGEPNLVAEEVNLDFIKREKQSTPTTGAAAPVTAAAALAETISAEADEGRRREDSGPGPETDGEKKAVTAETGSSAEKTEGTTEEAPRRSRRRRRRGRRGGARSENQDSARQDGAQQDAQPESGAAENDPQNSSEAKAEGTKEAASPAETGEQKAEGRPRRHRSRRKKQVTETASESDTRPADDAPTTAAVATSSDTNAGSVDEPVATPPGEEVKSPRRRRSAPRKKASSSQEEQGRTPDTAGTQQAEPSSGKSPEPEAAGELEAKPKQRRAPRKKKTEETAAAAATEAPTTSNLSRPAAEERAPAPNAESTRLPETARQEQSAATTDSAPAATPEQKETDQVAKPRRRAPRKKAADAPEKTEAAGAPIPPAEEAEKPKRRAPRKKVADAPEKTESAGAPIPPAAETEKPKRRAPRKKAVDAPEKTEAAGAPIPPAAETEKPKRRAPRKKVADAPEKSEIAGAPTPPAAETEKPKRRAPRKKATDAPEKTEPAEAPLPPAAEAEKPKRRATPKKPALEKGPDDVQEAPGAENAKPKRKSTPRKKTAPLQPEATAETAGDTPTATKPRRRAPRKKTETDEN